MQLTELPCALLGVRMDTVDSVFSNMCGRKQKPSTEFPSAATERGKILWGPYTERGLLYRSLPVRVSITIALFITL